MSSKPSRSATHNGHPRSVRVSPVDLSIVVPMKNEEAGVPRFSPGLGQVLSTLQLRVEFVVVDDGSTDETLATLLDFQKREPRLRIVELSRNFGKEAALTAGLERARGRAVICMDADLQDPPELIATMIDRWTQGADVVVAKRRSRASDGWFKKASASVFYAMFNALSEVPLLRQVADYRLMDRVVVDALLSLRERVRFNRGLFAWLGFRQEVLHFDRPDRHVGASKCNLRTMSAYALDGLVSFTSAPIRLLFAGGAVFLTAATVLALYAWWFWEDGGVGPWLAIGWLSLAGLQLLGLGVVGEYLLRTLRESKRRPLYLIRREYETEWISNVAPAPQIVRRLEAL